MTSDGIIYADVSRKASPERYDEITSLVRKPIEADQEFAEHMRRAEAEILPMFQPSENSPNWGWAKIGFSVERTGSAGLHRVIKDCTGAIVLQNHTYEDEIAWLASHGVIDA